MDPLMRCCGEDGTESLHPQAIFPASRVDPSTVRSTSNLIIPARMAIPGAII